MIGKPLGNLGKRLIYSLSLSSIIIFVFVIISISTVRNALDENIQGQRCLDEIDSYASDFFTSIIDQETGLRGYALTKNKTFLEPYEEGVKNYQESKRSLNQQCNRFPGLIKGSERLV